MNGQNVGYVRVSSVGQNTDRQLDGLVLDRVFEEKASAKNVQRPGYEACMQYLRQGDTLIVHSMDRLARNLVDLRRTVQMLTERGVKVQFFTEGLVFSGEDSPMATLLLSVMGAFAEFERALLHERQMEGIALARMKGVYKGRKKALTDLQVEEIGPRIAAGERKSKIARDLGITRQTLYQYLKAAENDSTAKFSSVRQRITQKTVKGNEEENDEAPCDLSYR